MSKYNLSLNSGEKKPIILDDLSFSNCVKITNDYEEMMKLLRIGVNLPILPEFKKYIFHDLKHFHAKSLVLIKSDSIKGHVLVYNHENETLFFGYFGVLEDNEDDINSLIDVLIKYAKENNFKYLRGPINIPTIIYGWGFMEKGFERNIIIHKPVNSPIYNRMFKKWSFLEYSKDNSYEGYITDFATVLLDSYDYKDYEIVQFDNWEDIEKVKNEFLVLSARNLQKKSVITPNTGELFDNYFEFVKRYGDPFMFVFVRYKKTNNLVGCIFGIPNPFSEYKNSISNSFVLLSIVVDREHRNKGIGLFLIDYILKQALEHNIQYLASCIGSHVDTIINISKKYKVNLSRVHTVYLKQL
ncbi:MAG: GNAT family N-acetyltransferase [Candidatus Hermodarchaeota archaeon]